MHLMPQFLNYLVALCYSRSSIIQTSLIRTLNYVNYQINDWCVSNRTHFSIITALLSYPNGLVTKGVWIIEGLFLSTNPPKHVKQMVDNLARIQTLLAIITIAVTV